MRPKAAEKAALAEKCARGEHTAIFSGVNGRTCLLCGDFCPNDRRASTRVVSQRRRLEVIRRHSVDGPQGDNWPPPTIAGATRPCRECGGVMVRDGDRWRCVKCG
jgi:hypothetical protein